MQLEYLPDGSEDCPLIRLFEFTVGELGQFCALLETCSSSPVGSKVPLHSQPYVTPMGGCTLVLSVGARSLGLRRTGGPADFTCTLDAESWMEARERAETLLPRVAEDGYQWLCDGEARLLLSRSGQW